MIVHDIYTQSKDTFEYPQIEKGTLWGLTSNE
jgi:hypothetical protein